MTRIFKNAVVAGMLVGLMAVPPGLAQADPIAGGENAAGFEWTLPTVGLPKVSVTLNGETHEVGGENAVGGTLKVALKGSDWELIPTQDLAGCAPGQSGADIALQGKTPNATLQASFVPLQGEPTVFDESPVENKYPTAHFGFCI